MALRVVLQTKCLFRSSEELSPRLNKPFDQNYHLNPNNKQRVDILALFSAISDLSASYYHGAFTPTLSLQFLAETRMIDFAHESLHPSHSEGAPEAGSTSQTGIRGPTVFSCLVVPQMF